MADDKPESSSLMASFDAWRQKWALKANIGVSEADREAREKEQAQKLQQAQCAKCEEYKHWMLNYSECFWFTF